MKYKITSAKKCDVCGLVIKKKYILHGRGKLPLLAQKREMPRELSSLFEFGSLYDPYFEEAEKKGGATNGRSHTKFGLFAKKIDRLAMLAAQKARFVAELAKDRADKAAEAIRKRRRRRPRRPSLLPSLCGALCACLAVALLSSATVIYKLFIEDRLGRYELVSLPDFVGSSYPDGDIFDAYEYCNINVKYEYSSDIPEGVVISQTPPANVTRRVYKDRSFCNVTLSVSIGERTFTMNDYRAIPLREAILELKNEAVRFSVSESYSDTVKAGHIISTSPSVGEIFSAERTVSICVSKGAKTRYATVPSLIGLTEQRATASLLSAGLMVDEVTYLQSHLPYGTVISQSHEPYSQLTEGSAVSFTVSAGQKYNEKTIPDLYGLTLDEARARLAEYGLVCGEIYKVGNGARDGTVVAQSPLPKTPITSGIVSVDIYVSS